MSFRSSFTIQSDTRYLSFLRQWVAAAFAVSDRKNFTHKAVMSCTLALVEAVDNAIFHAHHKKNNRPIRISLSAHNSSIVIEVTDTGKGIGYFRGKAPDSFTSHGRGLFLIHRLMTNVESRMKNGRHSLKMTYRL